MSEVIIGNIPVEDKLDGTLDESSDSIKGTVSSAETVKGNLQIERGIDGEDGVSPVVEIDKKNGVTTLTITDVEGTKTVDIKDGADGVQGEKGDAFTYEDFTPEQLTSLKGDKGDKGDTGSNGTSATHSWNGTVLTITSASGTSAADLKGEKGDQGPKGDSVEADQTYSALSTNPQSGVAVAQAIEESKPVVYEATVNAGAINIIQVDETTFGNIIKEGINRITLILSDDVIFKGESWYLSYYFASLYYFNGTKWEDVQLLSGVGYSKGQSMELECKWNGGSFDYVRIINLPSAIPLTEEEVKTYIDEALGAIAVGDEVEY